VHTVAVKQKLIVSVDADLAAERDEPGHIILAVSEYFASNHSTGV